MPRKAKKVEEVEEEEEEEEAGSGVFNGMVFAVSGKLSVSQSAFRSKILDNGGEFAGSVTKKVVCVLVRSVTFYQGYTPCYHSRRNRSSNR